jgi:hypothetical protein
VRRVARPEPYSGATSPRWFGVLGRMGYSMCVYACSLTPYAASWQNRREPRGAGGATRARGAVAPRQ